MDRIARNMRTADYSVREASERSASPLGKAFFRTTLETLFALRLPADRAICSDDGSGHSLDTIELGRVLSQTADKLGQPLDLLGRTAARMLADLMAGTRVENVTLPVELVVRSSASRPARDDQPASESAGSRVP